VAQFQRQFGDKFNDSPQTDDPDPLELIAGNGDSPGAVPVNEMDGDAWRAANVAWSLGP
jgi:hypothetical protein